MDWEKSMKRHLFLWSKVKNRQCNLGVTILVRGGLCLLSRHSLFFKKVRNSSGWGHEATAFHTYNDNYIHEIVEERANFYSNLTTEEGSLSAFQKKSWQKSLRNAQRIEGHVWSPLLTFCVISQWSCWFYQQH